MIIVTVTTEMVGPSSGTWMRAKICTGVAPSTRAASRISAGIPLSAAERMTITNPALIQMAATMIAGLMRSTLPVHAIGWKPGMKALSSALSRPMFALGLYTKSQMMAAAVAEIAIGKKITDFTIDS